MRTAEAVTSSENLFLFCMPKEKKVRPAQHQPKQPGRQYKMRPQPRSGARDYAGCGKLRDKVALITGGDSGIGRAAAVLFAKVLISRSFISTSTAMPGKRSGWSKPKAANVFYWPAMLAAKSFAKMRCSERRESSAKSTSWSTTPQSNTRRRA